MSTRQDQIREVINSGINYLATKQQKNGSFLSLSSANPDNFGKALKFHSVFSTALILGCSNNLEENQRIKLIKQKCASFLLSQKSPSWSFNYWVRGSRQAKKMPYPDDLDDTFCSLSALYQYNPQLFDGKVMAKIVTILTTTEKEEGGPYYTWLVADDADRIWKDVDLAVNSNIAYFLTLQDINLPNLNKFITSRVNQGKIESPYYPNSYPIIYFIARFCQEKEKYSSKLQKILLAQQKSNVWENPLDTALNISSLLSLGITFEKLTSVINYLISQQHPKGYWPAFAFCLDPATNGKPYYSGSSALTTAFCLEALQRYLTLAQQSNLDLMKTNQLKPNKSEIIYEQIIKNINKRLSTLDTHLKTQTLNSLETILQKENKKQVALLPYFFKMALGKKGEKLTDQFIIKLGMANIYGWIAYTIYDNFLDDEGDPKKLSVANLALRELTQIFTTILPKTTFDKFFHQIMDQLENANTWEVTHCRNELLRSKLRSIPSGKFFSNHSSPQQSCEVFWFKNKNFIIPDYGDFSRLAERSLGHALTPIAILYPLGFHDKSKEVKSLLQFFKHYLVARQLNDDAHDFEKDLRMGHINAVGALLLKEYPISTTVSVSAIMPKLQRIFWYKIIVKVSHEILKHTKLARKSLKQCLVVSDQTLADRMLAKIEAGAKSALQEREDAIKFLSSYRPGEKDL